MMFATQGWARTSRSLHGELVEVWEMTTYPDRGDPIYRLYVTDASRALDKGLSDSWDDVVGTRIDADDLPASVSREFDAVFGGGDGDD